MATLLSGSTFNGVKVWGGPGNAITNTIVGINAGVNLDVTAADNTFFGYKTGNEVVDACGNSVMGAYALRTAGGGAIGGAVNFNVVLGACAMQNISPAIERNVAIGTSVMSCASNSYCNVAIGFKSAECLNSGSKNTFVGYYAGKGSNMSNSNSNTAIGIRSICAISNGDNNIGIGFNAGDAVQNGATNIMIGACAGSNIINANDTISIGFSSTTSDNGGHTAAGSHTITCFRLGAGSWTNLSDSRDKSNIENLPNNLGLNFIRNLRPVKFNYDYRQNYVNKCGFEYGIKDSTLKQEFETYGFIAQEIETTLNSIQTQFDGLDKNNEGDYKLEYESLISPIIKSLQQTIERLEFLESKVS